MEARRAYRDMLVTTPGLGQCINGAILYDETIRQATADGTPFVKVLSDAGIIVGIKVDAGAKALAGHPGEKVTEGLGRTARAPAGLFRDGGALCQMARRRRSRALGRKRAERHLPERERTRAGALCGAVPGSGLVPVVEPEVLMDGGHTQAHCQEVTEALLRRVFHELAVQGVVLEGMILKPNMIVAGLACMRQATPEEVADATVQCLRRVVPAAVQGVAFLSGGQSGRSGFGAPERHAHAIRAHQHRAAAVAPVLFVRRALQHPALEIWAGEEANREAAQSALLRSSRSSCTALQGRYDRSMEA